MTPDRNLLFGIVALKQAVISGEQFQEACLRWLANRERPLDAILEEMSFITKSQRLEIEFAVSQLLTENEDDLNKAFETLADSKIKRSLELIDEQATDQVTSVLPEANNYVQLDQVEASSETQSRYNRTKKHSQGGEGIVWLTHDSHLRREIALKELRKDRVITVDTRRRFVKEARITGQLEHPNIVPVYELASNPDDAEPFFTMRFLAGTSFKRLIVDYHKNREQGHDDPLQFRRLLDVFISICNAIGYAHSRGVVHRDLKPQNVMLGSFGEVMVIDWGMAKVVHQKDEPPISAAEPSLTDMEGTIDIDMLDLPPTAEIKPDQFATVGGKEAAGRVMGTPAYMAPEQAAGKNDLINASTDIYGLGAILFAVLCGKHPHHGTTTMDLLEGIRKRPTPRVRDILPSVPAPLAAICGKAMEKEMADRYPSAKALADEISRWLADEPISVYTDPWTTRLARWTRKHRTLAQSIAGSLLVVALVATIAVVIVNRAYRQEAAARALATSATQQATANLNVALRITDTWLSGSQVMKFYPGTEKLRDVLLEQAANNYLEIAMSKGGDPMLTTQSGRAWILHGDVLRERNRDQEALASYLRARDMLAPLAKNIRDANVYPAADVAVVELDVATSLYKAAQVYTETAEWSEAEKVFGQALQWLPAAATTADQQFLMAKIRRAQADLQILQGKLNEGEQRLNEAEAILAAVVPLNHPERESYLNELAATRSALAQLLNKLGRSDEAQRKILSAIDTHSLLVRENPDNPRYLSELQIDRIRYAGIAVLQGEDETALNQYRSAVGDYDLLLQALPGAPRFRLNRATARIGIAQILMKLGQAPAANAEIQRAMSEIDELLASDLATSDDAKAAQQALLTEAQIQSDLNQNEQAAASLQEAIRGYRAALSTTPAKPDGKEPAAKPQPAKKPNPDYEYGLAVCLANLGSLLHKQDQLEPAAAAFDEAIEHFESARQAMSGDHAPLLDALAWTLADRALLRFRRQMSDEGGEDEMHVEEIRWKLPRVPEYLNHFAQFVLNSDDPFSKREETALEYTKELITRRDRNPRYWNLRAQALLRAGRYDECLTAIANARARREQIAVGMTSAADGFIEAFALAKTGKTVEAKQALEKAQALMDLQQPGNRELRQFREWAEQLLQPESKP